MTLPNNRTLRFTLAVGVLAVIAALTATACSNSQEGTSMSTHERICDVLDQDVAATVVDGEPQVVSKSIFDSPDVRGEKVVQCILQDSHGTPLLRIYTNPIADRAAATTALAGDRRDDHGEISTYHGDAGDGYTATYDSSMRPFPDGLHLDVINGNRTYDVVVYNKPGTSADERKKLAERVVANIAKNLAKRSPSNESAPAPTLSSEGASWLSNRLG